jgi:hypothetical protein
MENECPVIIKIPFSMVVSGPSQTGKSTYIRDMLLSEFIQPQPEHIIFIYQHWQPDYDIMKAKLNNIAFVEGWQSDICARFVPGKQNLLIIDDCAREAGDDKTLADCFTRNGHHLNLGVILITQNFFFPGSAAVTVRRNTHYLVLFQCRQDKRQIARFAQQILPRKWKAFLEAYEDAVKPFFAYLFVDLHQMCPEKFMLRGNVLSLQPTVYILE